MSTQWKFASQTASINLHPDRYIRYHLPYHDTIPGANVTVISGVAGRNSEAAALVERRMCERGQSLRGRAPTRLNCQGNS
jgi:hypothetical protein